MPTRKSAGLGSTIFASFAEIDDPRAPNVSHPLETVLLSIVVAVLCGADGFVQAEAIAKLKKSFIARFVDVKRGIPTHDTMTRVLAILNPEQFAQAFATFMAR